MACGGRFLCQTRENLATVVEGDLRAQLKDWQNAINDYDLAIEANPRNEFALINRAMIRACCPLAARFRDGKKAIADAHASVHLTHWNDGKMLEIPGQLICQSRGTRRCDQVSKGGSRNPCLQKEIQKLATLILKWYEQKKPSDWTHDLLNAEPIRHQRNRSILRKVATSSTHKKVPSWPSQTSPGDLASSYHLNTPPPPRPCALPLPPCSMPVFGSIRMPW